MRQTRTQRTFTACIAIAAVFVVACGSAGTTSPRPSATGTLSTVTATPTEDAGQLATRIAGSAGAKLGPAVLDAADYPPDFEVKRQQAKLVAAADVPGLPSDATGFFATTAISSGDEFVNLIAIAAESDADAAAAFDAFLPGAYLAGLTGGARDATSNPTSPVGGPPHARGFSYAGTVSANEGGQLTQHRVEGEALAFVRGRTFIVVVSAAYGSSQRRADVATIAAAIDGRLAASTGLN